ncbi:MAG: OadG family protein [Clostridiales bacterium]|nr:OadG family protein [Clostridiales bacterium]
MKQFVKRIALALCMTACFFALTACASASKETETLDPQMAAYISQLSEQLTIGVAAIGPEDAETAAYLLKQGESGLSGAVESWQNTYSDTGAFINVISSEAGISEEYYTGTVMVQCEKRQVEFKFLFVSSDGQQLDSIDSVSVNPEYTFGERMVKAAMNTAMGIGTVFCVLIFISLIIYCFRFINPAMESLKNGKKEAASTPAASAPAPAPVTPAPAAAAEDEDELRAVIAAAIAAYEADTQAVPAYVSSDPLMVRPISHGRRTKKRF